jgi:hypothetical protein
MSITEAEVASPAQLAALVVPSPRYTVESAIQSVELSPTGALIDVLEVGISLPDRPGVFHASIPLTGWRIFESGIDLTSLADRVEAIYAL